MSVALAECKAPFLQPITITSTLPRNLSLSMLMPYSLDAISHRFKLEGVRGIFNK